MERDTVGPKEAALILGVSTKTIRRRLQRGQIPFVDLNAGGTYRKPAISREHLERGLDTKALDPLSLRRR